MKPSGHQARITPSRDQSRMNYELRPLISRATPRADQKQPLDGDSDQSRLLLDINNAVVNHLDLEELLKVIFNCVKGVFKQTTAATLSVYEPESNRLRVHRLHSPQPETFREGMPIELKDTPSGLAFNSGQIVLIHKVTFEDFPSALIRRTLDDGVQSGCSVPLISHKRVLGTMTLGADCENGFSEADAELLGQVAQQIAMPVENALNFQNAERARDRAQLVLEAGNLIVASLELRDLLMATSACLRKYFKQDFCALSLYDEASGQLRLHTLDVFPDKPELDDGIPLDMEGTPAGRAFTTRQTLVIDRLNPDEYSSLAVRIAYSKGIRSGCSVPLIARDRALGVLAIASNLEAAFKPADVELLEHIANAVAIAVENVQNFEHANRERERAQTLLEINNAITTNLDLKELIQALAACLRSYFKNDFAGMSLYDEETNQLMVYSLDSSNIDKYLVEGALFPIEGTLNGLAFTSREPLIRNHIDPTESKWPQAQNFFEETGLKSACFIPMISGGRAVGVLNLASKHEDAFSKSDVELLVHIAGQIAIAVQNSMNFDRAKKAKERTQILLEANNAVATSLNLQDLLRSTSASLRMYFNHDVAGLALYDAEKQQLLVHAMDRNDDTVFIHEGTYVPLEGTPMAKAFNSGHRVLVAHINFDEFPGAQMREAYEAGWRSGCNVPLIAHNRKLGVLGLASYRENAFSDADAQLLESIASQVALAVENTLNFERANHERDRVQLMLEVTSAVVSNLDLKKLVKTVSASLRDIMPHDAAGIALYEPEQNHLREYTNVKYKDQLDAFREGESIPLEGTPAGQVFLTGQPLLIRGPNPAEYPADRYSQHPVEGSPKSACLAPLISHGKKLGIAGVSSTQVERFTEQDLELFSQISGQIALAVENSLQYREIESLKNKLASEKHYLEEEIKTEYNFGEIVGQSRALKEVLRKVETVAPTGSVVLICGETGTGKELIARAIHDLSGRRERTLVKLNCAAIPTGLLESELFGHEKGAFTGAVAQRVGRFELANKGTLFLDEVGEISTELQPKLLRVLQEQEFERLGSSRTVKVDARLIAATNCDLKQMVTDKQFRSDLYYRLNVFPIVLPPLRERLEDIPLLASYFAQKHSARMNKRIESIPGETMKALCEYAWPGNIRELENFIERSVILSLGSELQAPLAELQTSAPTSGNGAAGASKALTTMDDMERAHIEEVLRHTKGSIGGKGGAAEILGLPASTLRGRMKKLGLK